ncbi:S-formylglutathione hydrolase FrmB [Paenibacillus sp. UNCCL117]|uniref:alpha/beta hydrolase n=1 Tax=unclassified Paenibacillus TaxID=185978 RepID=UPI00088D826D|nr:MULTISPECIES: alpha/beta hydrolase family protein [unclassified Paenibacillus]SDE41288.1 S-formylglutathione hydrolase FrmB [Paenibacillus sp. cl123]SFW65461.1 S-formylglutathione hydrolase FrmB [Paenibacillus sp. UNCCL117]
MALMECHFFSEALGMSTSMNVIMPQQTRSQIGLAGHSHGESKHPVLFLLHGLSDDHTIWLRRTSIERYVASLGLAVVMPNVHRSFYQDMAYGLAYWTFVSEELPALARSFFPLAEEREKTFVAGLSMGGYGALKLGLSHPDRFAAAASLSGVTDVARLAKERLKPAELTAVFGRIEEVAGSERDLFHLLQQAGAADGPKPKLYQCCGTEDFLYNDNQRFREAAQTLDLDYTYEEHPGEHNWAYWDMTIQRVLQWLPLER